MPRRSRRETRSALESCSPKPSIATRPVLFGAAAEALGGLFKILANSTRVSLLHALVREGELCVSALARTCGMKPQAVSNQLQRLVDRGILAQRRGGNFIYYRVTDPCIEALLERGLCLLEESRARVGAGNGLGVASVRSGRAPQPASTGRTKDANGIKARWRRMARVSVGSER